jgi:hypothetical protein
MPFSKSTKRQRCENGQLVPEYNTIINLFPQISTSIQQTHNKLRL